MILSGERNFGVQVSAPNVTKHNINAEKWLKSLNEDNWDEDKLKGNVPSVSFERKTESFRTQKKSFEKVGIRFDSMVTTDGEVHWYHGSDKIVYEKQEIKHDLKYSKVRLGTVYYIGYSPDAIGGELIKDDVVLTKRVHDNKWTWWHAFAIRDEDHEFSEMTSGQRLVFKQTLAGMMPKTWIKEEITSVVPKEEEEVEEDKLEQMKKTLEKKEYVPDSNSETYTSSINEHRAKFEEIHGPKPAKDDPGFKTYVDTYRKYTEENPIKVKLDGAELFKCDAC